MKLIRTVVASNPSPMTLDGTRTYIVGDRRVAVIDPGPLLPRHLDAVADRIASAVVVTILLTHHHPDHSDGAPYLADLLGAQMPTPADADVIETDAGAVHAIATPGHTPDHFAFHLATERAVFCGDLMMGGMDTALVARPEGDLQQYLKSLSKLEDLQPRIILPAHGDPFEQPAAAIAQYVRHRMERVEQVLAALRRGSATADEIMTDIYGAQLDTRLRDYAREAVEAYLIYLEAEQRVRRAAPEKWSLL